MWICPYCGHTMTEEVARFKGCCGEVHCEELPEGVTEEEIERFMATGEFVDLTKENSNA